MNFIEFQNLSESKLDASRPADIAKEFDVTPQVVNNWRSRNTVPYRYVKILRKKIKKDRLDKSRGIIDGQGYSNYISSSNLGDPQPSLDILAVIKVFYGLLKNNFKIIIILTFSIGLLAAVRVLFFIDPVFNSSATLLPKNSPSNMPKFGGLADQFGLNMPSMSSSSGQIESAELYPELIYSRAMAEKILSREFESLLYKPKNKILMKILLNDSSAALNNPASYKMASNIFFSSVRVVTDRRSPVIRLSVNAVEPKLASDIAMAVIEELSLMQSKFKNNKSEKKKTFIQLRIVEVKAELVLLEEKLKTFREKNRKISSSPALLLRKERLMREVGLKMEVYTTLKSQFELAQIEGLNNNESVDIIDYPYIPFSRSAPIRKTHVLVGLIVGFSLSIFVVIFKERNKILDILTV